MNRGTFLCMKLEALLLLESHENQKIAAATPNQHTLIPVV